MEESGSCANISGSSLYIDSAVFEFLNQAAMELEYEPPTFHKAQNGIVITLYSPYGWFADIHFGAEPIIYGEIDQYQNRGIETTLYRYQRLRSVIDEMANHATHQQAYRYSLMEDDE